MIEVFQVVLISVILFNGYGCSPITKLGYEYIPEDDSWLRFHEFPATWWDARLRCHLEGGQLASPTSSKVADTMKATMAAHGLALRNVFVGVHATISKGDFTTMDGTPLSNISLPWAKGQPDNVDNAEDCVVMSGTGEAVDVQCARAFPYFCRKSDARMKVNNCSTTAEGYLEQRTGSCYKFHRVPRTWHRAAGACAADGAHLTVVNSDTESQVLNDLLMKHNKATLEKGNDDPRIVHIGFWDWNERGEWLTIFGQTLEEAGYARWNKNEPNNVAGKEFCGSMVIGGGLNDIPCVGAKLAFICEITPK